MRAIRPWAILPMLLASGADSIPNSTAGPETLTYGVEWKFVRAGTARFAWQPSPQGNVADLHLESSGLVSKLYRVNEDYKALSAPNLCSTGVEIRAEEGKKSMTASITFDRTNGKARMQERDLLKNTAKETSIDTPLCVHEYLAALMHMRTLGLQPGQAAVVPMSNGRKFAQVRVEAQEREEVKTPAGMFKTVRYEAFLFNKTLIERDARLHVWFTDDARRTPVQFRVRLPFLVGTINLQLEKHE